jgi:hypothetical protein
MNYKQLPWAVKLQMAIERKFAPIKQPTEEEIQQFLEEHPELKEIVIKYMMGGKSEKDPSDGLSSLNFNYTWSGRRNLPYPAYNGPQSAGGYSRP